MFTFWKDCNLHKLDFTSLIPRTCLTPSTWSLSFPLLKFSWQHQHSDQGQQIQQLFHPQPTYFLLIILDCWLTLSSWNFLLHRLSNTAFVWFPHPAPLTFPSLATLISLLKWGVRQSPLLGLLPFLHSSLATSFNFIIAITSFVGIPAKIGHYLYPCKHHMYISLLGNSSYILNLYFKSEKFKNHLSPNRILSLKWQLSYLKKWHPSSASYSGSELSLISNLST